MRRLDRYIVSALAMLGDKVFNYGPGDFVLTPIDLPIRSVHSKSFGALRMYAHILQWPLHVDRFASPTGR